MRIHISTPIDEASRILALFEQALPSATVVLIDGSAGERGDAAQADYVVTGYRNEKLFDREHGMKAIFAFSAGVSHLLSLPNLPRDVPLVRLEDAGMAQQMVRYAVAATLRFAQRFDVYARQQRDRVWRQMTPRNPRDINVGVLGLGVIGGEIARALSRFDFSVRGHARHRKEIAGVRCFIGDDQFNEFLTGLDVLVSILPLTGDTIGILNRAALSRLANGAHVINIGRGAHLVDADLLALLDEGKLSGATLDVFHDEPLQPGHPFWRRSDIAITPHISGMTLPDQAAMQIAAKIKRLERGLPITGIVDRERGY